MSASPTAIKAEVFLAHVTENVSKLTLYAPDKTSKENSLHLVKNYKNILYVITLPYSLFLSELLVNQSMDSVLDIFRIHCMGLF